MSTLENFKVMITWESSNEKSQQDSPDCVPNIQLKVSENGEVSLIDIKKSLENLGYSFENKTISYLDSKKKIYIFCRKSQNLYDLKISTQELSDKTVSLNFIYFTYFDKIH